MSNESGVSDTVISTPEGGGAIKGIGESFSPDLHTGTGNFTVPINLPSGRNDFQPELNLVYSTGNGNGPFGLGWNLSVPGVTRKTSKGVPRYRDGAQNPANWDTFMLSGSEDLVPVAVWEYRGSDQDELVKNENPTKGEFSNAPVVQFKPRTEGLFARIRYHRDGQNDYWEVESKDGKVSHYGTPSPDDADAGWEDPAVIADPQQEDNVFSWKLTETRDPFGNRIVYDYESDCHETETCSWNQLYLKRIRYVDYAETDDPDFLVSVNFDYEDRPDPFSDYSASFEIRTRKRCNRITIKMHADEERRFKSYDLTYLDQRDDLDELEERLPLNGVSLLSQIKVVGHDRAETQELPPLEFGHTQFRPTEREFFSVEGTELPAESLGSPDLELADLFGNGLPDIVEIGGTVRYWRNLGKGEFDRPRSMEQAPAGLTLADPDVQLIDADGDGRADLMADRNGLSGYFPLTFDGEWSQKGFHEYDTAPSFDLIDPEVQLVDLDGDGVTDAVRSGSRFECYFSDPDEGWNETRRVRRRSLDEFPDIDFSDPRVRWADMTGDGQQDIILVHDGNVEYWPNLGYGNWGGRVHMEQSPRFEYGYDPERVLIGDVDGDGAADLVYVDDNQVTLWINQSGNGWSDPIEITGTPSVTDVDDVRLVDLLGTGVAGVLWSASAGSNGRTREDSFFLDFTGGTKPYLLNEMDNHLGAVTRVDYAPSTEYLLTDREDPAIAWQTPLPFPVQVVDRVEAIDAISGSKQTTEYNYHHGYWDGAEREFRGFGMVEQYDSETFADYNTPGIHGEDAEFDTVNTEQFSPPTFTKTWFHQGPLEPEQGGWHDPDFSDEYWEGDDQLLGEATPLQTYLADADVPRYAKRDALRALRGRVLREETYALDGSDMEDRPYTVTERLHSVREEDAPAAGDEERKRVFFPHTVAERITQWDRGEDPQTRITFTEAFDDYGQPRQETRVALPRRSAKREGMNVAERGQLSGDEVNETQVLATHTRTEYADPKNDSYIHDRVAHERSFGLQNPPTVTENQPNELAAVLRDQVRTARSVRRSFARRMDNWQRDRPLPSAVELIGHTINHYDGQAFQGAPAGEVDGYGALTRTETLVLRDKQLNAIYGPRRPAYLGGNANLPEAAPADFGQNLGYNHRRDSAPEYHAGYYADTVRRRYDIQDSSVDEARGLVTAVEDALGHCTEIELDRYWTLPKRVTDPSGLTKTADYDYRLLKPKTVTGPNGHATHLHYTPLGQVRKRYLKARDGTGGSEAKPEFRHEYDLNAYRRTRDQDDPHPVFVHTTRRVHHASESSSGETIELRDYSDGFGRLVQKRTQAPELVFGSSGDDVGLPADQDATISPATEQRDPNRIVVSGWETYDNKGQIVGKYEPFFASGWDYDPETDAKRGEHVAQYYDPRGRLVRRVHPDGSEQRVVFGIPDSLSTPEEFEPTPWERYTYDPNDNAGRTHPTDSDLAPVDRHWNTPVSTIRDALGRRIGTVQRNDASGQQLERYFTAFEYDLRGNEISVTDRIGRLAFEYAYDLLDDRRRIESIDAGLKTVVLDASGNPIETRDSKGSIGLREFDEANRLTHLWARDDDSVGRVTLREELVYGDDDAVDPALARQHNLRGQLYEHYDEAGLLRFDGYDFKGNVVKKTRRVVSDEALSGGWTADWDAATPEDDLENAGYVTEVSYDALDRPTETTYPADVDGNRAKLTTAYDRSGRLKRVKLNGTPYVQRLAYNARGQRKLAAYGNGVMTRYTYDPRTLRLVRMRAEGYQYDQNTDTWNGTGQPLQDRRFQYDLVGNVLSIENRASDSGISGTADGPDRLVRDFEYDALYRLRKATGREHDFSNPKPAPWTDRQGHGDPAQTREYERHYSYDLADNMDRLRHIADGDDFTRLFEYKPGSNRLDELTVDDGTSDQYGYTFDSSGNLLKEGSTRRFQWDHADRMRKFTDQSRNNAPSIEVYCVYSADGQRIKKFVENRSRTESTTYIDGTFENYQWTDEGSTGRNIRIHIMDDQERIAQLRIGPTQHDDSSSAVQYHLSDHLGSSNVMIDKNGRQINREEYFPYGETSFGGAADRRFRYTANEREGESNLYYYGMRYYAPWLGRWMSTDPAGRTDGRNLYRYSSSNPVSLHDSSGRESSHPFLKYGRQFIGTPYRWGDNPPETFDCSGFVTYVVGKTTNDRLPKGDEGGLTDRILEGVRSSDSENWKRVTNQTPKPGDIIVKSGHIAFISKVSEKDHITLLHAEGGEYIKTEKEMEKRVKRWGGPSDYDAKKTMNSSEKKVYQTPVIEKPEDQTVSEYMEGEDYEIVRYVGGNFRIEGVAVLREKLRRANQKLRRINRIRGELMRQEARSDKLGEEAMLENMIETIEKQQAEVRAKKAELKSRITNLKAQGKISRAVDAARARPEAQRKVNEAVRSATAGSKGQERAQETINKAIDNTNNSH